MPPPKQFRYGVLTPEQLSSLSWKQVLQGMIDGELPHPPICQTMNFWVVECGDGFVAQEGEPGPQHHSPNGTMQGGWALTVLDC